MLTMDRQQAILDQLRKEHSATVTDLSHRYYISETSVRRDLARLEKLGLIRRTYGGAVIVDGENEVISLEARQQIESEAKTIMARKAISLVQNGQVIFLDSSSSALAVIPWLSQFNSLSVITNGIKAATMLAEYPQIRVYILGGSLNSRSLSVHGTFACKMLEDMNANIAFISPKGIDRSGSVFCADEEEAAIRRMMIRSSETSILLCNSKKLDQRGAFRLCSLSEVSTVICDKGQSDEWKPVFTEFQIKIL